MKRLLVVSSAALLALTSIVLAQVPPDAILRTQSGDRPVAAMQQSGQTYVSVADVVTALGGTVSPESTGFKVGLNGVVAAFGPDSRFAVVREDLIEMPAAPVNVDGKPFVPWQFFQGFLGRAAGQEVLWDAPSRVLTVRPQQQQTVLAQVSVANVQGGISKVVVTLSGPVEYSIVKEPAAYSVRFKTPIKPPYAEQAHEDANVAKTSFTANEFTVQLTGADVVADAYKLENPFRIVLDLRKGTAAPGPGALLPIPSKPVDLPGVRTIVVDPGHGGKDVGALGANGTMEKDATLALCRRLVPALEAKTGARVVLTREDDSVVSLDQRTAIANQYKADLFLSVHMNAAVVKDARGSETYFLSADASDEVARKAAETENAAGPIGTPPPMASNDLKLILWDLAQQEYLQESSRLALDLQEEMNAIAGIQNRGVKQAPFKVLVGASMPAALVEVAFITNPGEEAKLQDEKFVTSVVDALARAVVKYKTDYETRIGVIRPVPQGPVVPPKPGVAPQPAPAIPSAPAATSTARTGA